MLGMKSTALAAGFHADVIPIPHRYAIGCRLGKSVALPNPVQKPPKHCGVTYLTINVHKSVIPR
jgi:hypothetical protein